MVELETTEQAQRYLAQIHPNIPYAIHPFESGWVAKQILPPEENLTRGLGLANLIIDKETGIVTVHPSLATSMVGRPVRGGETDGQASSGPSRSIRTSGGSRSGASGRTRRGSRIR